MFDNKADAIMDFNKYKTYSNIYHSVYWFDKSEEKAKRIGPDYTTALIDRIVFDLDSYKTIRFNGHIEEVYTSDGLESIRKFRDWCIEHDYARRYVHSGGGFYGILGANGNPLKLRDAMIKITQECEMKTDPATIGDTSRMMRVLNSFNFSEHRKCYAIPLNEEELSLRYEQIHLLAFKPRIREKYIYGTRTFSLEKYKIDKYKINKKELYIKIIKCDDADKILEKYGWKVTDFCDTIKHIISSGYVGHYLRSELIKYFKSIVNMELEDCVNLIACLLGEEGIHSFVEGSAKHIYKNNRVFNPTKLKTMGYCHLNCFKCLKLRMIL